MKTTIIIFAFTFLAFIGLSVGAGASLKLQGTLRDQAPDTMNHSKYQENYWIYDGWTNNPKEGTCGDANGGKGWPNSDFELPLYLYGTIKQPNAQGGKQTNGEHGLVGNCCNASNSWTNCGRLGADRTPVYKYTGGSPLGTIRGPDSFYHWFHDTPHTFELLHNITLNSIGNRLYSYQNDYFFPLDGKGWKDSNKGDGNVYHNYAYCYEIHGRFSYQGGEVFNFEGDDDVWVYLDNRLVIDLGGIHTIQTASIQLDRMSGLVKGTNYRFDFFYCERHTTNSKLAITTSIEIACTYYDWCDICEGDGQSCCDARLIGDLCDDKDACTVDKCAVLVPPEKNCTHTRLVCNDDNACTIDTCDKVRGCVFTPITCDDKDLCTEDTCVRATGCLFTKKECPGDKCNLPVCSPTAGCSKTVVQCNDNDACTLDSCDATKGCVYTKVDCNDADACTTDTCDKVKGCQKVRINCNDTNACTVDSCSRDAGCQRSTLTCDDKNACTDDKCDISKGCDFTNRTCNDNDACTVDSCNPATGCSFQQRNCDDGNACTTDLCDKTRGCYSTNITCNDNDACTLDSCNKASGCSYQKKDCNDRNACTTDSCDKATGCKYANVTCNDNDKCTSDTCNPGSGCVFLPISCDDNDACTVDSCAAATGCVRTKLDCDDNNECTKDTCEKATGCAHAVITCTDGNYCTNDICDPLSGCKFPTIVCNDNDNCTLDSCVPSSGCQYSTKDCNDGNGCTLDKCDKVLGCQNPPQACDKCVDGIVPIVCTPLNNDHCFPVDCNPSTGECTITRPVICNDQSNCTVDSCIPASGDCKFDVVSCDDNNLCTVDTCDRLTGCKHTPINCDDKNPCTTDECVAGNCTNTAVPGFCISCLPSPDPCTWDDACYPKACVDNVCEVTAVNCDDNNHCTLDKCYTDASGKAACNNTAVVCDNSDVCRPQTCDEANGLCIAHPVLCDDGNACTTDSCTKVDGAAQCRFVDKPCANTPCNPQVCNTTTGICSGTPVQCDDNNACTTNNCVEEGGVAKCKFETIPCETTDRCNPKSCNTTTGDCLGTPVLCDDNNLCTENSCDDGACVFKAIECDNSDPCNPRTCELATGMCLVVPVDCDDLNACTDDLCVVVGGQANCSNPLITCDDKLTGDDCVPAVCDTVKGCIPGEWICDDGNICTDDICVGFMNCSYNLGLVCDDGDACTEDLCDSSAFTKAEACSYKNATCLPPTLCQVVLGCDAVNGCVYVPKECPQPDNWCKQAVCDEVAGCVDFDKSCVVDDADCFVGRCDSEAKQCHTDRRPDWTTITSSQGGGVTCFVLYETAKTAAIISGGVIAGIVVAAVVFAALAAVAARKAYLFMQLRQGNMGAAQTNPLYTPGTSTGVNPLFN